MKTSDAIKTAILQFRGGSLQIFGDWFGRPHDNLHKPKAVTVESTRLLVTFGEDELLIIDNPQGLVTSKTEFRVKRADRVRWEWFYYGRPKVPENRFYLDYQFSNGEVIGSTNVNWYQHKFNVAATEPAVRMK